MWKIFNRKKKKNKLDIKILSKNDISLLILDERWNSLFNKIVKTSDIIIYENRIKELLKEQSRIIEESKDIAIKKKECMDSIIKLTTEAFDKENQEAQTKMRDCEKTIVSINKRQKEIEDKLSDLPKEIKLANLELLEETVKVVYFSITGNRQRVMELDKKIAETKDLLKKLIDEREHIAEDDTDTYSYFHDLVGGAELQRLDEIYFSSQKIDS